MQQTPQVPGTFPRHLTRSRDVDVDGFISAYLRNDSLPSLNMKLRNPMYCNFKYDQNKTPPTNHMKYSMVTLNQAKQNAEIPTLPDNLTKSSVASVRQSLNDFPITSPRQNYGSHYEKHNVEPERSVPVQRFARKRFIIETGPVLPLGEKFVPHRLTSLSDPVTVQSALNRYQLNEKKERRSEYPRHDIIGHQSLQSYNPRFEVVPKYTSYDRPQFKDYTLNQYSAAQIIKAKNQTNY